LSDIRVVRVRVRVRLVDNGVYGCEDGSEVDRGRGPEVALDTEDTEPLCT